MEGLSALHALQRSAENPHLMKKHYILVSVEIPSDRSHDSQSRADAFLARTEGLADTASGIRKYHESCWLLERENAASSFATIVSVAEGLDLPYEVLYLSSDE